MTRISPLHIVPVSTIGAWNTPSGADSLCADKALQASADAQLKKAEDFERAGKLLRPMWRP